MNIAPFAAAMVLATFSNSAVEAQTRDTTAPRPFVSTQSVQGNYMTTADGCTYRRTQAPGYAAQWILVLNPHHIGRPNSPRHCSGIMR